MSSATDAHCADIKIFNTLPGIFISFMNETAQLKTTLKSCLNSSSFWSADQLMFKVTYSYHQLLIMKLEYHFYKGKVHSRTDLEGPERD